MPDTATVVVVSESKKRKEDDDIHARRRRSRSRSRESTSLVLAWISTTAEEEEEEDQAARWERMKASILGRREERIMAGRTRESMAPRMARWRGPCTAAMLFRPRMSSIDCG